MICHSRSSNILKIIAIVVFAAGGVYYLWTQHRAHVFQYLPVFIFLLCPLMHIFGGHGGHGGHGGGNGHDPSTDKKGNG